ncbi:hypothetical protein LguiA_035305 [Lonicera macranthoides]
MTLQFFSQYWPDKVDEWRRMGLKAANWMYDHVVLMVNIDVLEENISTCSSTRIPNGPSLECSNLVCFRFNMRCNLVLGRIVPALPAVVVAYLMRSKGWRLDQSSRWVKDRKPSIEFKSKSVLLLPIVTNERISKSIFGEIR